jgi:hypothetical protein
VIVPTFSRFWGLFVVCIEIVGCVQLLVLMICRD